MPVLESWPTVPTVVQCIEEFAHLSSPLKGRTGGLTVKLPMCSTHLGEIMLMSSSM